MAEKRAVSYIVSALLQRHLPAHGVLKKFCKDGERLWLAIAYTWAFEIVCSFTLGAGRACSYILPAEKLFSQPFET